MQHQAAREQIEDRVEEAIQRKAVWPERPKLQADQARQQADAYESEPAFDAKLAVVDVRQAVQQQALHKANGLERRAAEVEQLLQREAEIRREWAVLVQVAARVSQHVGDAGERGAVRVLAAQRDLG